MRDFFNSDSKVMRALSKLFDIGYLSIVFVLFSLPIITLGASLTALYYTTVKVIRRERGYVFQEFWRSFKLNFVPATIMWVIELVLLAIMIFNITVVAESDSYPGLLLGAYIVLGVLVYAVSCYAYPILSRFSMKTTEIIRLSLYMLVKHIYFTIPMIILSAVAAASVFLLVPYLPIIPIIVPALAAMLYSYMMEILLKKYMPKEVVEQWYNE